MLDSANNGGRITNRMIYDRQEKLINFSHANDKKIAVLETTSKIYGDEIKALRKKSNIWDGVNMVLIAIGTFLGIRE